MAKRANDMRRGNDLLYKPRPNCDEFDHYHGPFGGDMRQSIKGVAVDNRDELGGQQVQKIKGGKHGPARP